MSAHWLAGLTIADPANVDGLVPVIGYHSTDLHPEQVLVMERARRYGATAVFFEAARSGRAPTAQAFIYAQEGPHDDVEFARIHQRLWSWGGVPLVYRKVRGLVQLFRCAHQPDFMSKNGQLVCRPVRLLELAGEISSDPWWDAKQLRNGTIWDDPVVCSTLLSATKSAHKSLVEGIQRHYLLLNDHGILRPHLRRKLLILALLIAYLEDRGVFPDDYFGRFKTGATKFFEVLEDGDALVGLLSDLEARFNGNVFVLAHADRESLRNSAQIRKFAKLIEGLSDPTGQRNFWRLYSFEDLPVELISYIYQLFVTHSSTSVYTPPILARLMVEEALSWERLDELQDCDDVILDPSCGSGVFLVEAYRRLVLHWRIRNSWKNPTPAVLKQLLRKVHGIDLEEGAVELAAFSLCLALCDALEPETIRSQIKLFPMLLGKSLHHSCFFEAIENDLIKAPVGVVVGNPPFESKLTTPGAERSRDAFVEKHGALPDFQIAYLFLEEAMKVVEDGGLLCMLQQYNFLYNQQSRPFRQSFIKEWDVREVLDFISVRGLFEADTKVVVVLAEKRKAPAKRKILHATFRRTGRVEAEQGFDIDYYDMHWVDRRTALNDRIWRANLLGGGRVLQLVERL